MGEIEYCGHRIFVEKMTDDIVKINIDYNEPYRIVLNHIKESDNINIRVSFYGDCKEEDIIIPSNLIIDALDSITRW